MKTMLLTISFAAVLLASCGKANIKDPEYRDIRNIHLIELGVLSSKAGVDFVFYNPNNTSVQLSDARGDLYIDNVYFGRFQLNEKVQVGKRSEFIIPAIVSIDMIGAIKNQRDLLKKKEAMIRIDGTARLKKAGFSQEIPIRYEQMENIERFRSLITK